SPRSFLLRQLTENPGGNAIRVAGEPETGIRKAPARHYLSRSRRRFERSNGFRLQQQGDHMSMGSQPPKPADDVTRIEVRGLLNLQRNFLKHYFRLQAAERRLSARARRRERGAGRLAILHVERERQRIGRELHTGVGQMLAAIRLQMEIIATQLSNPSESVVQALSR